MTAELAPGTVVDRYVVDRKIASGGVSAVYLVRHGLLGASYALKVALEADRDIMRAFITEGRIQSVVLHPNVVRVVDAFSHNGGQALVLDYVDGPVLADWIHERQLDFDTTLKLFRAIVRGVFAAHRSHIVHRDLKPENILLARTPYGLVPKVIDFGIAKVLDPETLEASGISEVFGMIGTPEYMAPEQGLYAPGVDQRADMFSLGCILYEMVTGRVCFEAEDEGEAKRLVQHGLYEPATSIRKGIPPPIEAAILGLLEINMKKRIPDCVTLLRMLDDR